VLHIFELLVVYRNENINENKAGNHHEEHPEKVADNPGLVTVVHESVPRLASRRSKQRDHRRVECPKIRLRIYEVIITHLNIAKEIHRRYSESKNDQAKE